MGRIRQTRPPVVRTPAGALHATAAGPAGGDASVHAFLGVPFMAPPTGPLRFASPRPVEPWTGVRPAAALPPAFPQPGGPGPVGAPAPAEAFAEHAVRANVWTPDVHGSRPVLIYVHGGGWRAGSASSPTFDGARLAARADLVVVTFNYRLGPFGYGLHEQLADPETGLCANWGLQDQAALVEWVRSSIAAFGGDPENITLSGTSAGGAAVRQLALLPRLRGAVRRLVPISAAHLWAPAYALEPDDARTAFDLLADRLGVGVPGLRGVAVDTLLAAWEDCFRGAPDQRPVASGRWYRGPVQDGELVPGPDAHRPVPDLPTLTVTTDTEGSFYTAGALPQPVDDTELRGMVRAHLLQGRAGVPGEAADLAVRHYRARAREEGRADDAVSLYAEIVGDSMFRHQIVRLAERAATESRAPGYVLHFDHPVGPPSFGTPHEATAPFLFGTHGIPWHREIFGDGPVERHVSQTLMDLVSSFAHDGVPRSEAVPYWPAFTERNPRVLCLGGPAGPRITALPKAAQLEFWDTAGWHPAPDARGGPGR
ncbi:carboxylesterase family protein [Streptomyces sp. AC602_WCS936]|uniref:carboxylesterase family protein n=1 Tax=Streptomyces sp. AC602_WCS936 TaxID=2823685 RepID=UPI001C25B134|nr:carboxylesterase family protein [Streptomyces sp. AC602_WCS936]